MKYWPYIVLGLVAYAASLWAIYHWAVTTP